MVRGFDHLVICVNHLERARADYARLGFTLTPAATHPFGTRNSLVQFEQSNFLELLAVGDPSAIPPHAPDRFSFAAFNRDFLARNGEGLSMLAFTTGDAVADVARWRAGGIQTYDRFDFGRGAVLPDGRIAQVGFSLAFATHPAVPDATFFTCQHRHAPELFWRREFQHHANGALGVTEVVMSTPQPEQLGGFLANLAGATQAADAGQGLVTMLDPGELAERLPELPRVGLRVPARLRAVRVAVKDLDAASAVLEGLASPLRRAEGRLVIPPAIAHGVAIELVAGELVAGGLTTAG